jgi:hypothetical protein
MASVPLANLEGNTYEQPIGISVALVTVGADFFCSPAPSTAVRQQRCLASDLAAAAEHLVRIGEFASVISYRPRVDEKSLQAVRPKRHSRRDGRPRGATRKF